MLSHAGQDVPGGGDQRQLSAHEGYCRADAGVSPYATEPRTTSTSRESFAVAKYDPLTDFLKRQEQREIRMSFQRLEDVLGAGLPPSARSDRTWWGNTFNRTRVQAHAWLNAGWKVDAVDLTRELVTFIRSRS